MGVRRRRQLIRETDEEGNVLTWVYDRQNRLVVENRHLDGREIPTRYTLDPAGNRIHVRDPLGLVTETRYDQWGRPHQVIDPAEYVLTTERDADGNEVKTIDGNGHARTWIRDKRGLVVTAEETATYYTHGLIGNPETVANLVSVTKSMGNCRIMAERAKLKKKNLRDLLSRLKVNKK